MKKLEKTNLTDTLLFAFTVVSFVIGIDQTIRYGILESYWIFTFSVLFMLIYNLRRNRIASQSTPESPADQQPVSPPKKRGK
jgi:hypothetical protein